MVKVLQVATWNKKNIFAAKIPDFVFQVPNRMLKLFLGVENISYVVMHCIFRLSSFKFENAYICINCHSKRIKTGRKNK